MKGIYFLFKQLMWLVIILALLNGILTIASSSLVSWVASDALKEQPFRLSDNTQVVINPALLSVDIHDLLVESPQGEPIVTADRLSVDISWAGLLDNHLQINALSMNNAFVYTGRIPETSEFESLEQQSEQPPSASLKSEKQKQPWTLGLKDGEVEDLTIVGVLECSAESTEINRLNVRNLVLSDNRQLSLLSII